MSLIHNIIQIHNNVCGILFTFSLDVGNVLQNNVSVIEHCYASEFNVMLSSIELNYAM